MQIPVAFDVLNLDDCSGWCTGAYLVSWRGATLLRATQSIFARCQANGLCQAAEPGTKASNTADAISLQSPVDHAKPIGRALLSTWASSASVPFDEQFSSLLALYRTLLNATATAPVGVLHRLAAADLLSVARRVYSSGDKLTCSSYSTDCPRRTHAYELMYAAHLAPIRMQHIRFLEIGLGCNMAKGAGLSVQLWLEYLPNAQIWMAEYDERCYRAKSKEIEAESKGRVNVLLGDQGNVAVLKNWMRLSGGKFDFIIDDGGHRASQQWTSLINLWPSLAPGGVYLIEDMGENRHPLYSDYSKSPNASLTVTTLSGALGMLLDDVIEFGGGTSAHSLAKVGIHQSSLGKLLPRLKSVQCFSEICALLKCGHWESRCP